MLSGAFVLTLLLCADFELSPVVLRFAVLWLAILAGGWLLVALYLETYSLARAARAGPSVIVTACTALFTCWVCELASHLTPWISKRETNPVLFPLAAATGVAAWRAFYAAVFVQPVFRRKALVVGAGGCGRALTRTLTGTNGGNASGAAYDIIGFVDSDRSRTGQLVSGIPVLGSSGDLLSLVRSRRPDEVIVAVADTRLIPEDLFQAILSCRELGVAVAMMATLYESVSGRVPVEYAGRDLDIVLPRSKTAGHRLYLVARRLIDVLLALIGCLVVAALAPFIWLLNRLSSPGDLFYRQERLGEAGRPFQLIKFRSMIAEAERETGAVWASESDHRVTPVGRWLRRLRLDELPQAWNVLKGEMSFIGPRPERPSIVEELARQIPFFRLRHACKPGITGWAQVRYGYGASVQDALIKLQYDLYYIKHQSVHLDLLVLLKTVQVMLGLKGR